MKTTTLKALLNGGLIPTEMVRHTRKFCWLPTEKDVRDWGHQATIFLLVGYCPNTLPYYMGLVKTVLNDFGKRVNLDEVKFGHVHTSRWCKGFTVLEVPIKWTEKTVPAGYEQLYQIDFYYE